MLQANRVAVLAGDAGAGAASPLPLELLARGDFEPQYRAPLDVGGGERPVLPLSIYGAVALAHLPADPDGATGLASSRQFFIYEFDRGSSGLAVGTAGWHCAAARAPLRPPPPPPPLPLPRCALALSRRAALMPHPHPHPTRAHTHTCVTGNRLQ